VKITKNEQCIDRLWPDHLAESVPEEQVLAEIAQAGYAGAPAGPSKGRTPQETSALFAQFGLQPAPGYFSPDFWKVEREAEILSAAREYARYHTRVGVD
jgi:inosose dehydratase